MPSVQDSRLDTSELESFEEFEAEGHRYQTDMDLAALMNSFGLANDSNAQSGPGGQVAAAEAIYNEHEERVDEPRSAGTRRSAVGSNAFVGDEDQVPFAGLVSTTPLVIDLDEDSDDEVGNLQVDNNAHEIQGNADHAQDDGDLAEVFEPVNGDEGDAGAAAAVAQLAYEIFDAPDSDDEAEAQVVPEAHATAFLNGVLSEFHAAQVTSAAVEVQVPPAMGYVSNIQILGPQAVQGGEDIIFETSVEAELVKDLLDSFMKVHDDIHRRLQSADDFLANVQVMKVNHVPGEVTYEIQVHEQSFTNVISEMYVWVSEQPSVGVQPLAQHGIAAAEPSQEQSSFGPDVFEVVISEETQADVPTYEAIDVQATEETPVDMNVFMFSPIEFQVTFEDVESMEIDMHFDDAHTDAHMTHCDEGAVCAYTDEPVQVIESYGVCEYAEAPNFLFPAFDANTAYTEPYGVVTAYEVQYGYQGQFEFHSGITDVNLPQFSTFSPQEGEAHHQAMYQADIQGPAHVETNMDMLDAEAFSHQEGNLTLTDSYDGVSTLVCDARDAEMSSPLVGGMDSDDPVNPRSTNKVATACGGTTNNCDLASDLELELMISGFRQLRVNDDLINFGVPVETEYSVEQLQQVEQVQCRRCEMVLLPTSAPLSPPGLEAGCPFHGRVTPEFSSCSTVSLSCEPNFMDISPHLLQDFFTRSLEDPFSGRAGAAPLHLANPDGSHLDTPTGDLIDVDVVDSEDSLLSRGTTPSPPPPYCPLPTDPSADANTPPIPPPESHALLSEVKVELDCEFRVSVLIADGGPRPIFITPARRFDLRPKPVHRHHLALWSNEVKGRIHGNIPKPPKKKILRALPLTPKRRFDKDEPAPQPVKKPSLLRRTARLLTFGFW